MKERIRSIDLFAGCGGLMEGFEQSGHYETLACVEWEKAPCDNLRKRLLEKWRYADAGKRVLRFDIRRVEELFAGWHGDAEYGSSQGLDELTGEKGVDIIIGGPPCQAYSVAGRIRDENGMNDDYRNYLFENYLEVVKRYKPRLFVFENVPGLLSARPGGVKIVELIKKQFQEIGYETMENLKDTVIDFTEYGIPQNRKRMIILGLNREVYGEECGSLLKQFYEEELPSRKVSVKKTVREAIGDLPGLYPLEEGGQALGKKYSHSPAESVVPNHIPRWHNRRDIDLFCMLARDIESGEGKYLSTASLKELYTKLTGKTSNVHKYYVLRWGEQSNTIPAHLYKDGLRHIHPDSRQARTLTVREAARLQTFPDDYEFTGSMMEQYKMIGNAVPPGFSGILADAVYHMFFNGGEEERR